MPEPITGAVALAKAMGSEEPENVKVAGNLLTRLVGPSVDEFGAALARSVAYRTRNFGRIAARAEAKSQGKHDGIISERVAFVMLEDGCLYDNELMAEYLGGTIAGARTPTGKDDRAVSWIKIISSLSSLQIRAHYLLYREWAARLHGRDFNLGMHDVLSVIMDVHLDDFGTALSADSGLTFEELIPHALTGLTDSGLLMLEIACGERSIVAPDSPFENVLRVGPSMRGCELYGWAQGLPGLTADKFTMLAEVFDVEPPIPRLDRVAFLKLPISPPPVSS